MTYRQWLAGGCGLACAGVAALVGLLVVQIFAAALTDGLNVFVSGCVSGLLTAGGG